MLILGVTKRPDWGGREFRFSRRSAVILRRSPSMRRVLLPKWLTFLVEERFSRVWVSCLLALLAVRHDLDRYGSSELGIYPSGTGYLWCLLCDDTLICGQLVTRSLVSGISSNLLRLWEQPSDVRVISVVELLLLGCCVLWWKNVISRYKDKRIIELPYVGSRRLAALFSRAAAVKL